VAETQGDRGQTQGRPGGDPGSPPFPSSQEQQPKRPDKSRSDGVAVGGDTHSDGDATAEPDRATRGRVSVCQCVGVSVGVSVRASACGCASGCAWVCAWGCACGCGCPCACVVRALRPGYERCGGSGCSRLLSMEPVDISHLLHPFGGGRLRVIPGRSTLRHSSVLRLVPLCEMSHIDVRCSTPAMRSLLPRWCCLMQASSRQAPGELQASSAQAS
jgi:hypothetical protein